MKLIVISDTHGYKPPLPSGDVLIHCGDMTAYGSEEETRNYLTWMSEQPFFMKLVVPGNHDLWLYEEYKQAIEHDLSDLYWIQKQYRENGIHILIDEQVTLDPGLTICKDQKYSFYGSPWTPMFNNWAFMEEDKNLHKYFQKIPEGVDVLVTHGPAYGILDKPSYQLRLGSQSLLYHINRAKPKHHVFGHIHASYGMYPPYFAGSDQEEPDTWHYNCAIMGEDYKPTHEPVEIEL